MMGAHRLLFVIKSLALQGGGAERVLTQLVGELARRGHEVEIATFDPEGAQPFYELGPDAEWHKLQIGVAHQRTRSGTAARRITALRHLVSRQRPDVAIGFMHSSYVPLAIACTGTGVRVVGSEHISFDHYRTRLIEVAAIYATLGLLTAMTAVTERVRQGFPKPVRRKMIAMPNPVLPPGPGARVVAAGGGEKVLLSVGRLEDQKDHPTLIDAFGRIADQFPDWRLRIIGEGSLRDKLQADIIARGLEGRIDLAGAREDISREYRSADLFVMPSLYESFGLGTAEALAHGVPAVGFADCPGTNEIIRHDLNGLLVSGPDRAAALADGLATLMNSEAKRDRMGTAGPPSVEQYSLNTVVDRWEMLLASVVSSSRTAAATPGDSDEQA